jgi:hypothetical protein
MGDSSVLVLHLVFPVEETMTHFFMEIQALSWTRGCAPAWMAASDEERKSQAILLYLDTVTKNVDLRREFAAWDVLSDEAFLSLEQRKP